ncbi:MAG: C45 family peptidase [Mariniblastus sp.]|nr:C45 family peptidase [Mariniblastus sp.]
MIDCNFPILQFERNRTPRQWGQRHGESYREAIAELVQIRTDLMREKNPGLDRQRIEQLADEQWQLTGQFDAELTDELTGIAEGADISLTDLVILNNYTDFRDIQVDDQGCSLVYANSDAGPVVGQTWDMHGSAKRYVCCLRVPDRHSDHEAVLFSLVGCVGMMGFTSRQTVLGVNNINVTGAVAGILWPVLVRAVLNQPSLAEMSRCLTTAPVTSGHNYLLAERDAAEMWEVAPRLAESVGQMKPSEHGFMFHTNHCLGEAMQQREATISLNSTTHVRHELLTRKVPAVATLDQMYDLMNDHENYPKSICSNFQADTQDPSITCGGAVGHLDTGEIRMWRGDPVHDDHFRLCSFQLHPAPK